MREIERDAEHTTPRKRDTNLYNYKYKPSDYVRDDVNLGLFI